jgi:hypothetical protein
MAIAAGGNTISEPARASFQWLASETSAAPAFNRKMNQLIYFNAGTALPKVPVVSRVAKSREIGIAVANWPQ